MLLGGAALLLVLAAGAAHAADAGQGYVRISGTRVSLKRPYGMVLARSFSGLQTPDGSVAITVTEVQRPFQQAALSYTKEGLAAAGVTLLGRDDVEISGQTGLIAYARQGEIALWLAAFGNDKETVVLRATAPLSGAKKISDKIHEILATATWEREVDVSPFQGLDFELAGKIPLKFAVRLGPDLYFTRDGKVRTDPDEPELVVGRRERKVAKEDRDEFCKTTLEATPGIGLTSDAQQADVRVDGLDGCEMMVAGFEKHTKNEILVYQLILFSADGHYLFRGRTGWEQQFRFVGTLIESVRAFKRKT
jgi:hypothetical protein